MVLFRCDSLASVEGAKSELDIFCRIVMFLRPIENHPQSILTCLSVNGVMKFPFIMLLYDKPRLQSHICF